MVNASELRIDNWVNLRIKDQSFFGKVDSIHRDYIHIGNGIKADLEFIYPITLTPSLLEKTGFKVTGTYHYAYNGFVIEYRGGHFWFAWKPYRELYIPGNRFTRFMYVHEIQNLYCTLTGEELSITLD